MNLPLLSARSQLLQQLRQFFLDRGFIETETPTLAREIIPEAHIDPVEIPGLGYLQASPEMQMKQLLCAGATKLFQIGKSYRAGEQGNWHTPEFTMVEWYRVGDDLQQGIDLIEQLLTQLAATPPVTRTTYRKAFIRHAGFDPHTASLAELSRAAEDPYVATTRDEWLNYWLVKRVEPALGLDAPEVITHYPASQASLAALTTDDQGTIVAERFELYWRGVEVANGFYELTDVVELRERLELANRQRVSRGAPPLPLPTELFRRMESPGLPPTTGVALGFDRLAMLILGATTIDDVLWKA